MCKWFILFYTTFFPAHFINAGYNSVDQSITCFIIFVAPDTQTTSPPTYWLMLQMTNCWVKPQDKNPVHFISISCHLIHSYSILTVNAGAGNTSNELLSFTQHQLDDCTYWKDILHEFPHCESMCPKMGQEKRSSACWQNKAGKHWGKKILGWAEQWWKDC